MPSFAIISDLHVGRGSRTPDLNPFAAKTGPSDGFLNAFKTLIHDRKLKADFLIVPGDIADRGHPNEYSRAREVILTAASALKVPEKKIVIGLGNHDSCWPLSSALKDDVSGLSKQLRFAPITDQTWFHRKVSAGRRSLVKHPFFYTTRHKDVYFVCYNSASFDDYDNEPHHGIAHQDHLDAIEAELQVAKLSPKDLKIFITHHHPIIYSDPRPSQPDFSSMTNSENLMNLLRQYRFDLFIHGHKHSPRFNVHSKDAGHPIAVLCAGSFSRELDTSFTGVVGNQFHLLEVHGRRHESNEIFGVLQSWAFRVNAWVESKSGSYGIPHRTAFGCAISPGELKKRIEHELHQTFSQKGHLKMADFLGWEPELKYMRASTFLSVIASICGSWGCSQHGATEDTLDELVLVK